MSTLRRSGTVLYGLVALLLILPIGELAAQVLDRSVARVRLTHTASIGQRALRSQVELYERQAGTSLSAAQRREVLEIMINEELIEQAAERDGISVSEEELDRRIAQERMSLGAQVAEEQFRLLVEQQLGMSYDDYRSELRKQLLQQRYIQETERQRFESIAEPSESEIREVYNENVTEFINPAMVRFSHVYVDTRQLDENERSRAMDTLRDVWQELEAGDRSFGEAYDRAQTESALGSADFGYLPRNDRELRQQLGSSFVDSLFELETDEVAGLLESNVGAHIVRITDKRDRRFLELDDQLLPDHDVTVRQNIREYLMNQRLQQEFQEATESVLTRLRDEAEIEITESNLDW